MVNIAPLFIEILIILLLIFAYQIFIFNRVGTYSNDIKRMWITIFCFSAIILVMHFPFCFVTGSIYDLRKIPFLVGILYGGPIVGITLTVLLILYRFFIIGSDIGAIITLILYTVILISTFFIIPMFEKWSKNKRVVFLSFLAIIFSINSGIIDYFIGVRINNNEIIFYGVFIIFNGITMALSVYLIENMREHKKMLVEISKNEKMDVIGQLTASVAHEIRNPLTTSRGFIQLTKESLTDEKMRSYLEMAMSEMDRSLEIIKEYLSFAKPEYENKNIINLQEIIQKTCSLIKPFANLHIVEITLTEESLLFTEGNSKKLTQCLVNIMKNGIEAMPNGGEMRISLYAVKGNAVISISDNGSGMTKEQVSRLGSPFYSTKDTGTGLGLMASYSIIRAMNGEIEVESEMGKGSTFLIYLPVKTL